MELNNSLTNLKIPPIITNNFPEKTPIIGIFANPATNLFDHQNPTKLIYKQEPYYIDTSYFKKTCINITFCTEVYKN